jgi:hypothetical protein
MRLLALALLLVPSVARADDYEPGIVPEGMNAYVHQHHELHLSVLGTSQLALTDHTELATYLLADAVLFPNLRVEHQLAANEHGAASLMLGAGAGLLPLAFGAILPLPGAVIAGGGLGVAWGSIQTGTVLGTVRFPDLGYSVSLNAGGFAAEGGIAGIVGAVGGGGGGAGGGAGATSTSSSRLGVTFGMEADKTFGKHDALIVALDEWRWQPLTMDGPTGLIYPRITWTHQTGHWQLTGGVYALIDTPSYSALHAKMPVSPYFNVAWNH